MFINKKVIELLDISAETVKSLREEVVHLKATNEELQKDLTATRINNDWFRIKINDLEATNKALLERAYDIRLPVPQIVREQRHDPNPYKLPLALFDHIDEETAKALGEDNLT